MAKQEFSPLKPAAEMAAKDLACKVYGDLTGIRFVVYGVSDDGRELSVLAHAGRTDTPRPFSASDERGRAAFEELETIDGHTFRPDSPGTTYVGYLAAPIRSTNQAFGMITMDATSTDLLEASDGPLLEIVASALSHFFAEAARGAHARRN